MKKVVLKLNEKGYVSNRESMQLEFKQAFQLGDSLHTYARTMVGMANNSGGAIVYGVKDKPHLPIGLKNDKIDKFDPSRMTQVLLEFFSHDVDWEIDTFEQHGGRFGVIRVDEAPIKPVVCSKTKQSAKLREGAIYYRYRAETREIRYQELVNLLQSERDKEKRLWMDHIQSIAQIGPQYVQIADAARGEMQVGGAKVLLDESLVKKLKVIKEGQFREREGAPTLRLVGDIDGLVSSDHAVYAESAYPHTQSTIVDQLPINQYEFQAIVWKLDAKENRRFHMEVSTGKSSVVHKYSEKFLQFIKEKIRSDESFVENCKESFSEMKREARRAGK